VRGQETSNTPKRSSPARLTRSREDAKLNN
jgi:hypothetical protein